MRLLVERYAGLVWSLVRRKVRSNSDAEDLVQEIFADVWRSSPRYDAQAGSEDTFVAMIARRRVIDHIRRTTRAGAPVPLSDASAQAADTSDPAPGVGLDAGVQARRAMKVLGALRPERRRALELSIVHGLSHTQIAESTGMPLGTVKAHVRRGLDEVRRMLQPQLPAESTKEVSP